MTIVPDAPWWANIILLLVAVTVPTIFAARSKNEAKRAANSVEHAHEQTSEKLGRVLHNVENSHAINLRDDIDRKIESVLSAVEDVSNRQDELLAEQRDQRVEIRRTRRDITGLRQDARRDRRVIGEVERKFNEALDKAQDLLDINHPNGPRLVDGGPPHQH